MKCILPILVLGMAAGPFAAETLSLAEAQKQLFRNNLEILAAEVDLAKTKDELAESRSAWWPSLDASASYTYLTEKNRLKLNNMQLLPGMPPATIDRTIGANDRAECGLDLTYPLFAGFSRYYSVESRTKAVSAKLSTLEAVKNRSSLSLGIIYLQWDLSYKQADLRRVLVEQLQTYTRQVQAMREAGNDKT